MKVDKTPLEGWLLKKIKGGTAGGECLTPEMIRGYQLDKIRETLDLAVRQSPFYGRRLKGWSGGDIAALEDLTRLPFTTAEDIKENPLKFLCVSQDEISRVVTLQSSGTGGESKRLYFTREDQEHIIDFFHYGMACLVDPGDRVLILLPGRLPGSVGDLLRSGLERLGAVPVPHGPVTDPEATLQVMRQEQVDSLVGIPTQVLALARCREDPGKPAAPRLKSMLLTTDHVPGSIAKILRRTWGCPVFNHYGMTEMGLGGAVECRALAGYHLREADLYFEIIDPATGKTVPEGQYGEVVFTTLTRKGMPLLRYRTGDVSRFIPGPCPCGTVMRRLESVRGRLSGKVRLGGNVFITMADLDQAIFPLDGVLNFTAGVSREKETDCLRLEITAADWAGPELAARARAAVESLPDIKRALESGALKVEISSGREGDKFNTGTAKRTIKDLRNAGVN
ncbi:phenylacetate-coenzyme A ligase [Desulfocucumis palustris]|uniref:Phenylacetate-coenzyme A ligase n=1 Tax=Desulfocucumis palustris TaxID=1898651 RepID=A0A2L2XFU1_9FIRM|nr:AMP-binding protein [Desulfocucumis palustris]GBF35219.1 phenylacetate-coenzyme A ligase [Desulfocucumis palustris]